MGCGASSANEKFATRNTSSNNNNNEQPSNARKIENSQEIPSSSKKIENSQEPQSNPEIIDHSQEQSNNQKKTENSKSQFNHEVITTNNKIVPNYEESPDTIIPMSSDSQVLTIGIGKFGTHSLYNFYKQIASEHNITKSTSPFDIKEPTVSFDDCFFYETSKNTKQARCVLFDCQDNLLSEINSNPDSEYFKLFNTNNVLNEERDYDFMFAYDKTETIENMIRKEAEKCDILSSIINISSLEDSKNRNINHKLKDKICCDYALSPLIGISSMFDVKDMSDIDLFNSTISFSSMIEYSALDFLLNRNILKQAATRLKIKNDTSHEYNNNEYVLVGKLLSDFTSMYRFKNNSGSGFNIKKLMNHLVPYPRLHFMDISYTISDDQNSMFSDLMSDEASLTGTKLDYNDYMSVTSLYFFRGLVTKNTLCDYFDANFYNKVIQANFNTSSPFCPIITTLNTPHTFSGIRIKNSTSIVPIFNEICENVDVKTSENAFDKIFEQNKELDTYVLSEGLENLRAITQDYTECIQNNEEEYEEG